MKFTVFAKTVILLICLLVPILLLYTYANQANVDMVVEEKQQSSLNQFNYFSSQVDKNIEQLSLYGLTLLRDPSILHYRYMTDSTSQYEKNSIYLDILDKLSLYQSTSRWKNDITIVLPQAELVLSTMSSRTVYDEKMLTFPQPGQWQLEQGSFTYFFTDNYEWNEKPVNTGVRTVMEINFDPMNVVAMLDDFKETQGGDPFLLVPGNDPLLNRTADRELVEAIMRDIPFDGPEREGNHQLEVGDKQYLVSYVHSKQLQAVYVNPVVLDDLLTPMDKSRNMFITSILLLLVLSIGAALLLYRKVQVPIHRLMRGLQQIRKGQLSTRIPVDHSRDEFAYLTQSFNHMAEQIQELIEKVYEERIRSREATLKHLQSQINPHFLYNCLFYIKNMTQLGNREAVIAMSLSLGDYYRYITRGENDMTTVEEEIRLLDHYLSIQQMRTNRLTYEIAVPQQLMQLHIPRLLIQPIVENAVIHGIEPMEGSGHVVVTGMAVSEHIEGRKYTRYSLFVDNDGVTLTAEEIAELEREINEPMGEEIGTGTWNVHQRLVTRYGLSSGLHFGAIPYGGLSVEIRWFEEEQMYDESDGRG
ncbi:two-component system, sensor histidine kinase YesM [Paenibacillus sp. CF095]|uniref:sensor histidine kinase n=1 Tax=Paenibacillus sp. CF095 TaxID=1881033 RepID=UPI00088241D4|nr:histidine kinase [Paenibacillus sp. CF095]SDD80117.1 two-component system, sensor histidine kinase YesM [Paenibacillus sp. CF095]